MRLLLFADLHLDRPFAWATPELARGRRQSLRRSLERVCRLASERRVDALCCAGDLYEQDRWTPDTASFLRRSFAELWPLPIFLAPGNHDWLGPSSLYQQVEWTDNVHVASQPRLEPHTLADGCTLWTAAHMAPSGTRGFLDGFSVDRGGVHLALFHGSELGGLSREGRDKAPHAPFTAKQVGEAGLHHALVGHYHTPRDAPEHTYPGNPDPLSFGEAGVRGAVLVEAGPDGGVRRERLVVASSVVADVTVAVTGAEDGALVRARVVEALRGLTGVARVNLVGELGPDVELDLGGLASCAPWLEAVVVRAEAVEPAYDLALLAEERTVRGQFVRDVMAAPELGADQRRRVLSTGLRALTGRASELGTLMLRPASREGALAGRPTEEAG